MDLKRPPKFRGSDRVLVCSVSFALAQAKKPGQLSHGFIEPQLSHGFIEPGQAIMLV
jgi:hypothetical protein